MFLRRWVTSEAYLSICVLLLAVHFVLILQSVKTTSSRQLCLPALPVFILFPRLIRDRVAGNESWIHAPPVDALGVAPEMAEVTDQSDVFLSMVQDIATELDLHQVSALTHRSSSPFSDATDKYFNRRISQLCHKILANVGRLTAADRGSLFLVESVNGDHFSEEDLGTPYLVPKLFDVTVDSGMSFYK